MVTLGVKLIYCKCFKEVERCGNQLLFSLSILGVYETHASKRTPWDT